jgi:hypothetical protein
MPPIGRLPNGSQRAAAAPTFERGEEMVCGVKAET